MRKTLKQFNFSDKEIDVYLAALKLGSASITELAKRAKIKRPTTYVILEKLKEMGLVSMSIRQKKRIFTIQKPDKLSKIIDLEKEKLEEKEKELQKVLPELKSLTKEETLIPIIRYFEGKEGVWDIIDDLMESGESASMISTGKAYDELGFKRIVKDVIERRRKIGTTAYIISDHHPEQVKEYKKGETLFRQYRFLPETIDLDSIVYIYADKIALVFFKEPLSGVIIENKALFQSFKFMFDSLWDELEGKNLPE
jgi:sugar-specific transcriptional regulator TrmB